MVEVFQKAKSDFYDTYLSTKFELRKHYRRNRIQMAVLLALVLASIFYIVPTIWDISIAESAGEFALINLSFVSLLVIIAGALFAGDIISSEFENRTSLILFPTPQDRNSIFVGKYIASVLSTLLVLTIYYIVTAVEIQYVYGISSISTEFLKSYLFSIVYMCGAVSLIFFLSSILERAITSTLLGFFSLLMIMPIIEQVLKLVEVEPWFLITYYDDFITDVLAVAQSTNFGGPPSAFITPFTPDFNTGIIVILGYTMIFFLMSLVFADRRRVE